MRHFIVDMKKDKDGLYWVYQRRFLFFWEKACGTSDRIDAAILMNICENEVRTQFGDVK